MAQIESLSHLLRRLDHLRLHIEDDEDTREAQWYEPWDLVLNWLRIRTDLRLTVAPQFTLTREYYESTYEGSNISVDCLTFDCLKTEGSKDYSMTADTSVSSDVDGFLVIKDQGRTPDFSMFFASGDFRTRSLPVVVEIKPYHPIKGDADDAVLGAMEDTRYQLLEQVSFGLDRYRVLDVMYVLCVIGWHWDMLKFERGPNNELSTGKYVGKDKGKKKAPDDSHTFRPRYLLNKKRTDLSNEFKEEWNNAMGCVQLTTNFQK
jgi:hypothetical protein